MSLLDAALRGTIATPLIVPVVVAAVWRSWQNARLGSISQPDENTDVTFFIFLLFWCPGVYLTVAAFFGTVFLLVHYLNNSDLLLPLMAQSVNSSVIYQYLNRQYQSTSKVHQGGQNILYHAIPVIIIWGFIYPLSFWLVPSGSTPFVATSISRPEWCLAGAETLYLIGYMTKGSLTQITQKQLSPLLVEVMNVVVTLIVLMTALAGFYLMDSFKAVLWLFFWVWAYPVALAFTQYGKGSPTRNLLELYLLGVSQIPFVGRLLIKPFLVRPSSEPPKRAGSASGSQTVTSGTEPNPPSTTPTDTEPSNAQPIGTELNPVAGATPTPSSESSSQRTPKKRKPKKDTSPPATTTETSKTAPQGPTSDTAAPASE